MRYSVIILTLFLGACGFQPLYGEKNSGKFVELALQGIHLNQTEGRLGQMLQNQLSQSFNQQNQVDSSKYELFLEVEEVSERYGFNQDRSTTRESYALVTHFKLLDIDTGEILTTGRSTARTSYDVAQSDFSNHSAKQDAQARMVLETAQNITLKLSLFFNTTTE